MFSDVHVSDPSQMKYFMEIFIPKFKRKKYSDFFGLWKKFNFFSCLFDESKGLKGLSNVYVEDLTDTVSSSTVAGVVKCTVTVSFNI